MAPNPCTVTETMRWTTVFSSLGSAPPTSHSPGMDRFLSVAPHEVVLHR